MAAKADIEFQRDTARKCDHNHAAGQNECPASWDKC